MANPDKKIKAIRLPSYNLVRELFHYDPLSGVLSRRVFSKGGKSAGTPVGCKRPDGQMVVRIDRISYRVHRIIWLWMTGAEPENQIDHRDTDASNNKWENLREANYMQNAANKTGYCKSGIKGAYFNEQVGRWYSRIRKHGINYSLGYFDTPYEANAAYKKKAKELFGEFARAA